MGEILIAIFGWAVVIWACIFWTIATWRGIYWLRMRHASSSSQEVIIDCNRCIDIGIIVDSVGNDFLCPLGCKASEPYWTLYKVHAEETCRCTTCSPPKRTYPDESHLRYTSVSSKYQAKCNKNPDFYDEHAIYTMDEREAINIVRGYDQPRESLSWGVYSLKGNYVGYSLIDLVLRKADALHLPVNWLSATEFEVKGKNESSYKPADPRYKIRKGDRIQIRKAKSIVREF